VSVYKVVCVCVLCAHDVIMTSSPVANQREGSMVASGVGGASGCASKEGAS
jgi:hypothetical protein